ncbi:DMT family transporter [Saliphagus infecundisoli]|uniref:DMT family transporter n=1 Tax=Saliphagus infecundisoli TaxID=1849069 RepID=A0ABD5QEC0_9EURY|nr:DMT family transporter [Saliphagus infecundisoli]
MSSQKDLLLFVLLSVIWGSGFVIVKTGQQYFPPVFYAALCFDVTAIGLFLYVRIQENQWRPKTRQSWFAIVSIGLFTITIYNTFFFIGQRSAPSAVGAILLSFIPVLTAILARGLVPDERFTAVDIGGILVGLVGVGLIIRPSPETLATGDVGRLLILVAAASNALGAVLVQRIDPPEPTSVILAWAILPGGVALHLVSLFIVRELYENIIITLHSVLAVAYIAVLVNVIGYIIFFTLLKRRGAFEVSLVNYLQPISAAIIGWFVLSEQLDTITIFGFFVILAGFALMKRDQIQTLLH